MDFFEQQDQARKKTGRLVFLFGVAVVLIIMTIYTVGVVAYAAVEAYAYEESSYYNDPYQSHYTPPQAAGGGDGKDDEEGGSSSGGTFGPTIEAGGMTIEVLNPTIFGIVSLFVLMTVGLGSLFKIRSLRGGGASVAMSMGGRLINPDTQEFKERQLLNIVEEMAIASGVPVPLVYVMDNEDAINAFAAGYTINDAAIAVTSGLLEKLSRDEVQGVVAHEYSHILNGDMRLNIRLIGVLFGILVIGNTGLWLIRIAAHTRGGRNNAAPLVLFAGGAILALVGYVGVFFGRLIKAAVSRQREFLADASAVQFTRNPKGISGALQKIGGFAGSRVEARQAEDLSHMFFSNAIGKMMFGGALATHPPLKDRISRIDRDFEQILKMSGGPQLGGGGPPAGASGFAGGTPAGAAGFSGGAPGGAPASGAPAGGAPAPSRAVQGGVSAPVAAAAAAAASQPSSAGPQTLRIDAGEVVKQVGSMTSGHLAYTANIIAAIPQPLRDSTHSLLPAVGLIYSLLLDPDPAVRNKQMIHLERMSAPPIVQETKRIAAMLGQIHPKARIPLVEMCIPTSAAARTTPI